MAITDLRREIGRLPEQPGVYLYFNRAGETIYVEPFRANAFPVLRDLVVDRGSFDRIIAAGGFVSANTGAAPDANSIPVPKDDAEAAMDAAACIGCGACVAASFLGAG